MSTLIMNLNFSPLKLTSGMHSDTFLKPGAGGTDSIEIALAGGEEGPEGDLVFTSGDRQAAGADSGGRWPVRISRSGLQG